MSVAQVEHVEQALRRISRQVPEIHELESLLCRLFTILGRDISTRLDQALAPAGLADLEFRTLLTIFSRDGAATPGDLANSLAQSPANLTRIGDALVARGLVVCAASEEDRRRILLRITPAGEELLRKLLPEVSGYTGALFRGFSTEDKLRLLRDVKRLVAGLDRLEIRPLAPGVGQTA
jgi:MarR family transcriptional repressor of emrRAB